MNNYDTLNAYSKEELIRLIELYEKNWLALDGVWFQAVESRRGMEEAVGCDAEAWERFTAIEAKRLKDFLGLPEQAGLNGLAQALRLRLYAGLNRDEISLADHVLTYRVLDCRVQTARKRKKMPFHPCKPVGLLEYAGFARTIDSRISCECLRCYPDAGDESCCCAWRFTLNE